MSSYSWTRADGRSSGKFLRTFGKFTNPPKDQTWAWLTRELLESDAWRAMSPNTRKLIDFLMIEHMSHAGRSNGALKATYDQLVEYGLTRSLIRTAIDQAEALGLIRVGPRMMRTATKFTLTWTGTFNERTGEGGYPTNDWKHQTETCSKRCVNDLKSAKPKKRKTGPRTGTDLVTERAPVGQFKSISLSEETSQIQHSSTKNTGTTSRTPSISGKGYKANFKLAPIEDLVTRMGGDPPPRKDDDLLFADRVRDARAQLQLTQSALAARVGVSQSTVSRVESKSTFLNAAAQQKFRSALAIEN